MKLIQNIVILLLFLLNVCSAQIFQRHSSIEPPHDVSILPLHPDTIKQSDTLQSVVIRRPSEITPQSKGYESTKSTGLAVLFSAVLPGAGQIYNESYWKAPVIWGLGAYWASEWIDLNKKYKDFRDQYNQSIQPTLPSGDLQLQRLRDFYRDERDKFAWYIGLLYFVNLLDAYVSASLYDFNVTPDLGVNGMSVPYITASVRFRF